MDEQSTPVTSPVTSFETPGQNTEKMIRDLGPWFQNLHLPGGVQTSPNHPLGDFPSFKWNQIGKDLPADLSGWSALDIGCNAGFYSFELARRNAQVLGIDREPLYLAQARWAAERFHLENRVQFRQMQLYDLAHTTETFDIVLFLGVFYHLRYPLLGLDIVVQKMRRLLVFQSLTMPGEEVLQQTAGFEINDRRALLEPGWPKMAYFEQGFVGDRTNWWAPNHACIEAMLRSAGMHVLARPGHEIYICQPDPAHEGCAAGWNREEFLAAAGISPRPIADTVEPRG